MKAKIGLIIDFNMSSEEKDLVNKFVLGTAKQSTLLRLGKYGNIKVSDILDMTFIPSQKEKMNINIEDLFNSNNFKVGNIFE